MKDFELIYNIDEVQNIDRIIFIFGHICKYLLYLGIIYHEHVNQDILMSLYNNSTKYLNMSTPRASLAMHLLSYIIPFLSNIRNVNNNLIKKAYNRITDAIIYQLF